MTGLSEETRNLILGTMEHASRAACYLGQTDHQTRPDMVNAARQVFEAAVKVMSIEGLAELNKLVLEAVTAIGSAVMDAEDEDETALHKALAELAMAGRCAELATEEAQKGGAS